MITRIAIQRSAQSVLHTSSLTREEANRIGEHIAEKLSCPFNFQQAVQRYHTSDVFEVGEHAAREYVRCMLK